MQGLVELSESVRDQAVRVDEVSVTGLPLADLWSQLTGGRQKILDAFFTQKRCIALLTTQRPPRVPLNARLLDTFESVVLSGAQKGVAAESNVAASTVAVRCKEVMHYLGVDGTYARVPLLLAILVHARRRNGALHVGRSSRLGSNQGDLLVVSFQRPDLELRRHLSPTESEVASLCMEGYSHEQMSAIRGSAERTIANQLGCVYKKLGLSGRGEFLAWLAGESGRMSSQGPELLLLGVPSA